MKSAFNKEVVRAVTRSAGRFIAIAIISLLGAGFYAGLRMAAPDMRIAGDEFFDATNTFDISVVSTLGLDDDSLSSLAQVQGVGEVMGAHRADAMVRIGESSYAASVESLSDAAASSDTADGVHALSDAKDYLNRPILVEGAWPASGRECVVGENSRESLGVALGDEVVIEGAVGEVEDTFAQTRFDIVGFVNAPTYIASNQMGATSLGTGEIELFMFVGTQAFDADLPYSVAYLSVPKARAEQWDSAAYDEAIAPVKERVEQAAPGIAEHRWEAVVSEAQRELDDARAEYEEERADAEAKLDDAARELDDAQSELDDAARQLADTEGKLSNASAQLFNAWGELEGNQTKLDDAARELEEGQAQLDANRAELDEGEREYAAGLEQLQAQRAELEPQLSQLPTMKQSYAALEEQIAQPGLPDEMAEELKAQAAELAEGIAQLEAAQQALDEAQATLDVSRAELDAGRSELDAAQATLDASRAELEQGRSQLADGRAQYESGLNEYLTGRAAYQDGLAEYEDGRAEYEDGRAEYESNRAEADEKFADAEAELAEAQADIDGIDYPEVYVLDRTKNPGAASLSSDADGITQIATFLPFMFFLVAALVSLTSMTRMVDEERLEIGTHKALGYSRARITSKYLVYGALASGAGAAIGIVALGKLLPWFILTSYAVSYDVPVFPLPLEPVTTAKALGLSVGVTLVATWGAAAASLRERPASLMLPRVPKAGKRIFLERIRPLWARMSFSQKVTARNLLRYKRRFFMAVVGVAGCTALLMIGFGLRDAIGGIVGNQYEVLVSYDAAVRLDDDISEERRDAVEGALAKAGADSYLAVYDFNMIAQGPSDDLRIEVVVPSDADALPEFVKLRDRKSGEELAPGENGAVLTEKAARVLGVSAGGDVELYDENDVGDKVGEPRTFAVEGISENYLGHFAYLLPSAYRDAFGEEPDYGLLYVKLADGADAARFSDDMLSLDGVSTVSFVADKISTYEDMLDVMNKLIYVIMLLSAALAFVVLYNLTNINITERVREIATLKVLGFTKGEVSAYIFREIVVMALIGALLGCVLGVPLTFYIAEAAETANMMFGRAIEPASYVLSFVITMAFTGVVALAMRRKLAGVNMVESLKSVE